MIGTNGSVKSKGRAASPSPSEGGDVRGYGGIWRLTKPREWSRQVPFEGGDVLKKGGGVSLLTASLSPSRGGDVPDGVRVSDEKIE